MTDNIRQDASLSPYRVLDLTDEKGYMCGQILGGLGADVLKIEPPDGDYGRRIGPFYKDIVKPENSLYWFAYNVNKRSITLDLEKSEGKEIFRKLVKTADFVVESFPPGYMDKLGLEYSILSQINPGIIYTAITPYGQSGPHSQLKGSDLTCMAASNYMWLSGDADLAPLRISIPQAYIHGGSEAAMASLIAFWHRQLTGEGQAVDVSIQESLLWMCLNAQATWDLSHVLLKREGQFRVFGSYRMRQIFKCKDGHVVYMMIGGSVGTRGQKALVKWMDREGMANDLLKSIQWDTFDARTYDDKLSRQLEPLFEKFFLTKTKQELYKAALKMSFLLAPLENIADVLHSEHFRARDFWVEIQHPELETSLTYPGAPFKSNEVAWVFNRRPPLIGEHNDEVYMQELGISQKELVFLKQSEVI